MAALSHGVLDKLGRFAYRPPGILLEDAFWVSYHSFIVLPTALILYKTWGRYKIGLIFQCSPTSTGL